MIVVDGVYSVDLGSITPMTSTVLAGGVAFLEITIDGETLVPRQQLLSVPYSLVTQSVGGVPAVVFEEVWASFSFDGNPPENSHPDEGLIDTDSDGVPNFLDPDNDNDGISDGAELIAGTSINLISPRIDSVTPNPITSFTPTTLVVTGAFLDTLTSVSFGGETPTPIGLTASGFSIDVVSETLSVAESVQLSIANGESGSSSPVAIQAVAPTIGSISPLFAAADEQTILTILGTGFYPGTVVQIGSQVLVPTALSETSITVTMGPESVGTVSVEVIHPNSLSASTTLLVVPEGPKIVFLSDTQTDGDMGGIAGANAICQADAAAASLSGTFLAWLSVSVASGNSSSPATTFNTDTGPFLLPGGVQVADDWTDLIDGTLDAPINHTASGETGVNSFVWTGTQSDGSAAATAAETCSEWSTTASTGSGGSASLDSNSWTENFVTSASCTAVFRLYCFEQ